MTTKPDWRQIKADYVETQLTLAQVEEKWGVPRGTLSARATRERWREERQQFAAKLEHSRRAEIIAKRTLEQEQFENILLMVATRQLTTIARHMKDEEVDVSRLVKLTNALETVQRIGMLLYGTTK